MTHWLRALDSLIEDLGSVHPHDDSQTPVAPVPGDLRSLFDFYRHCIHRVHTYRQTQTYSKH